MINDNRIPLRRSRSVWERHEWVKLAELVFPMRLAHPDESLVALANRAMEQFPRDRQRELLNLKCMAPLVEILRDIGERVRRDAEEAAALRQGRETTKDAEQVLAELDDAEVYRRFSGRVFAQATPDDVLLHFTLAELLPYMSEESLVGAAAVALFKALKPRPEPRAEPRLPVFREVAPEGFPAAQPAPVSRPTLPYFVLVGGTGAQQAEVLRRIKGRARVRVVDALNAKSAPIPPRADVYFLWAKFIGHHTQNEVEKVLGGDRSKMVLCHGGVGQIADLMEEKARELAPGKNGAAVVQH